MRGGVEPCITMVQWRHHYKTITFSCTFVLYTLLTFLIIVKYFPVLYYILVHFYFPLSPIININFAATTNYTANETTYISEFHSANRTELVSEPWVWCCCRPQNHTKTHQIIHVNHYECITCSFCVVYHTMYTFNARIMDSVDLCVSLFSGCYYHHLLRFFW